MQNNTKTVREACMELTKTLMEKYNLSVNELIKIIEDCVNDLRIANITEQNVIDFAEKTDPNYGRCETCKNYGRCNICSECEDGDLYEFDIEFYQKTHEKKILQWIEEKGEENNNLL